MHNEQPVTFKDWITWLEKRHPMPLIAPGLDRTLHALKSSGLFNTHNPKHTIHIAGTNGKGTTAKALAHLISSTGETVGLFTSPHLVSTCERIAVNTLPIQEDEFVELCKKHYVTIIDSELTHFESLTLFAYDYFVNIKKTKWMIFEIGLGGLWDSTNAISHGTSVITTLGYDHMHILGNTIEEIAKNKFGIIHDNNTVIHQIYSSSVNALLTNTISKTNSKSIVPQQWDYSIEPGRIPKYTLIIGEKKISLPLPGKRVVENISTAIAVFIELGFELSHLQSLESLSWPARLTPLTVPHSPCPVYLSGDHNEQGVESLCEILQHSTYNNLKVILGLSKNRSHEDFTKHITRLRNTELVFTAPSFQGVIPQENRFAPFYEKPQTALEETLLHAQSDDLIVITGSLYLFGDYLKLYPSK
jgi:dihydrofolate synthase / folylpolyglutamate synthase